MPLKTATTSPVSRRRAGFPAARPKPAAKPAAKRAPLTPNTLPHFREFCRRLRLDNGKPFILEPFQELILTDYFDGYLETLVLLPSGNGKTALFAALALYHLLFWPDPEVFIMAASRDQAGRMLKHIKGFVERSPGLMKRVQVVRRGARLKGGKPGELEVLASDADTADGIGPTLALIDELHRHKDEALYEVALKGLKKRGGQLIHCTTAGESLNSPLGRLRRRARKIKGLRREGMHSFARNKTKTLAYHEWSLSQKDDMHDVRLVKQANPLSTITIKQLEAEHEAMKWWAWARFACGLWVAGEHSAVSPTDWASCPSKPLTDDQRTTLAIDLAWVGDCTAIVPVQGHSRKDIRIGRPAIIEPPGDGAAIREAQILQAVEYFKQSVHATRVVIDPEAGGRALIEKLEDLGLEVIEHSQKNEPMLDAAMRFDEVIRTRVLSHPHEETLTAHVLAAAAKPFSDGRHKLVKRRKDPEPIDGAVASAMGVRVVLAELDEEPLDLSLYRLERVDS